jgi:FdhE protein
LRSESWDRRIARAKQLATDNETARPLLIFYAELLRLQKNLSDLTRARHGWIASGSLDQDLAAFRSGVPAFLDAIVRTGPEPLVVDARQLIEGPDGAIDDLLRACWRAPSDREFLAKAILQPYARGLADAGIAPADRDLARADNRCPFCGGMPQLSILQGAGGSLEGGGRALLCATCLTVWPFRRVLCVHCGEEDERKLGYFRSPTYDHMRIDACDTCRRYLKSIDLTRLGTAVPIVDEVAGASLDLWALQHDYEKIELNLVGL